MRVIASDFGAIPLKKSIAFEIVVIESDQKPPTFEIPDEIEVSEGSTLLDTILKFKVKTNMKTDQAYNIHLNSVHGQNLSRLPEKFR